MKLFKIQKLIDFVRNYIDSKDPTKVKIYYIGKAKYHNAGDIFNEHIMKYLGIKFKKVRATNANLFCIGSILNSIIISPENGKHNSNECHILGAGLMEMPKEEDVLAKKIKVYALRGNLTKKSLEKLDKTEFNCVLADPGLLISYLYPCNIDVKPYKVGIIPHFKDKNDEFLNNIQLEKYNYKIIDIEANIEQIIQDINSCECILSSSLHGLIFSDSYGVPNRQILLTKRRTLFKYEDYYSSFNQNLPQIIDLSVEKVTDEVINKVIEEYSIKKEDVTIKQEDLIKALKNYAEEVLN